MDDELWLRASAMTDDDMAAVELLLCLKQSAVSPPRPPDHKPTATSSVSPLPPLAWGVRQPRSKAAAASVSGKKERREPTSRRSPTTPLSWSGGGGGSGGAGGDASPPSGDDDGGYDDEEESSPRRPDRCVPAAVRSKGANDSSTTPSTSKKSRRRKKTFAELKEEESSLLRIRTDLKKALTSMRSRFKEQQLLNESLKRRKIELQLKPVKSTQLEPDSMVRHANNGREVESSCCSDLDASSNILKQVKEQRSVTHSCDSRSVQNVSSSCQEPAFVLPDLNMIPDGNEDDSRL